MKARILVVEDNGPMGELVQTLLRELKHESIWVKSLEAASEKIAESPAFDLLTLDVNLPDGNGLDFCKQIRAEGFTAPIIMLTTESSADAVIRGLEAGANDYLKKPIEARELQARLRGHLKQIEGGQILEFKGLRVNLETRVAEFDEKPIDLSGRQIDILACLMRRPEVVFTRQKMIEALGRDAEITDRTIDSHMSQIRAKLKQGGVKNIVISSIYGVGYRLE